MAVLSSTSPARKTPIFLTISFLFLLSFYITNHTRSPYSLPVHLQSSNSIANPSTHLSSNKGCTALHELPDNRAKCLFLRSTTQCQPGGYIDYLQLFYCNCGNNAALGFVVLALWLILLFYLLGDTAASYFCSSLEHLSVVLKLSPTLAGVTLLSLGNGANDVFSSIVSFTRAGDGDVGLNSVLGGALFISTVVVGVIAITIAPRRVAVDKSSFIRDVLFLILVLAVLLVILAVGRINVWGAAGFTFLYCIYVAMASSAQLWKKEVSLLPVHKLAGDLGSPFLVEKTAEDDPIAISTSKEGDNKTHQGIKRFWYSLHPSASYWGNWLLYLLELPLSLPRRLTIPVICEGKWSKPFAVISVVSAPVLLAALWVSEEGGTAAGSGIAAYLVGGSAGAVFGVLALVGTSRSSPPERFLFLWLAGGFLMSVVWTYITAAELVALLVSIGTILGVSPSVLGLTVLAWGNSLGDLISDAAMAVRGGAGGGQVAISGCYAGPIFNTLLGLGLSLVFSSWHVYPRSYEVPKDPSLFQTLGFLVGGLLWALVILPAKGMRLDRVLGVGLLAIYFCFLALRLAQTVGFV